MEWKICEIMNLTKRFQNNVYLSFLDEGRKCYDGKLRVVFFFFYNSCIFMLE